MQRIRPINDQLEVPATFATAPHTFEQPASGAYERPPFTNAPLGYSSLRISPTSDPGPGELQFQSCRRLGGALEAKAAQQNGTQPTASPPRPDAAGRPPLVSFETLQAPPPQSAARLEPRAHRDLKVASRADTPVNPCPEGFVREVLLATREVQLARIVPHSTSAASINTHAMPEGIRRPGRQVRDNDALSVISTLCDDEAHEDAEHIISV